MIINLIRQDAKIKNFEQEQNNREDNLNARQHQITLPKIENGLSIKAAYTASLPIKLSPVFEILDDGILAFADQALDEFLCNFTYRS